MPGITIENIGSGSSIDLTGLIDDGNINPVWSGTPKGGTLTINDGTVASTSLFLTGIQNGATFSVESDAGGGTVISTDNVPCFAAGTRVRTERGDRLVEGLEVGDIVLTGKDRRKATIVWLGYRHVSARRHPHPENVWPVRIAAEALADGVPARDVWLSPEHAVFLHGVLVPARHLINGATIRQIAVPEITYWHVELAEHALLTTEGMLSESYLDVGNRGDFEGLGVVALHPDFMAPLAALWAAKACAPQCRGGRMLEGIRQNLMRRAVRLGYSDVARNEEVVGLRA